MITLILIGLLRSVRTERSLVLENLALRHQLVVLERTVPRPRLRTARRLFWHPAVPVPSTYSVRLVCIEPSAGLIDDDRHDHPDAHRPPLRAQDPPRHGARKSGVRHQLVALQRTVRRPRLRTADRLFWVLLSRLWSGWADAVSIVQPATVIRWQRSAFQLFWAWKSGRNGPGRPAVAPEVRALIRQMSRANPLWGAPRIHGELQKLGIEISQATVSKYVVRPKRPPSQTWRTFLDHHIRSLASVDFFTVVGRKNSIHRPFLLPGPVKDSRQVEDGRGGQRDQVGGESDRGVGETQSGLDRRESVPASAADRAATPGATPTAP